MKSCKRVITYWSGIQEKCFISLLRNLKFLTLICSGVGSKFKMGEGVGGDKKLWLFLTPTHPSIPGSDAFDMNNKDYIFKIPLKREEK